MHNPMMQQPSQGERDSSFSVSDDDVFMEQVLDTHHPDGTNIDVKPLVLVVKEILRHAITIATTDEDASTSSVAHIDLGKEDHESQQINIDMMLNSISHVIENLACEMSFKCLTGRDEHSIALELFHKVANFHWDAKLVLILVAFAQNYGEFWLLAQIHSSIQLSKSRVDPRQVPTIMEHSATLKTRYDALYKLIHSVLELTQCNSQLKEIPSHVIYEPAMAIALTQFQLLFIGMHGISSTEMQSWGPSSLILKINHLLEFLQKQLEECHRLIGEWIFKQGLKMLLNPMDDHLPLFDGAIKQRVSLEVLRKRNVLLLISGLYMPREKLSILEKIYSESRTQGSRIDSLYEVVWVPIMDPYIEYTDAMHAQFENMKNSMPWYSVNHPSNITQEVKKTIRDRWHFRNQPILIVIDPQGRVSNPNAMHMMWIGETPPSHSPQQAVADPELFLTGGTN